MAEGDPLSDLLSVEFEVFGKVQGKFSSNLNKSNGANGFKKIKILFFSFNKSLDDVEEDFHEFSFLRFE